MLKYVSRLRSTRAGAYGKTRPTDEVRVRALSMSLRNSQGISWPRSMGIRTPRSAVPRVGCLYPNSLRLLLLISITGGSLLTNTSKLLLLRLLHSGRFTVVVTRAKRAELGHLYFRSIY
ncbi:hypothetical protein K504DRAFT_131807 [Pleomassaria siparia CBS 279.74]|uniref:Uncharacterized protein n=1 Tax=Pleomassaria siparia CBS 279.74 TaxID=1314801 RepID=A0A6G1KKS0_9PLEO|nr:hypothetical protein K504DRAFT_131807 [Pleomassaria siparia CBS 279.74]